MNPVGPVLCAGAAADAVIAAIRRESPGVEVIDRGAYLRVQAPGRVTVTRAAIEAEIGRPFSLPGELEQIMTSFAGRMRIDEDGAEWTETTR